MRQSTLFKFYARKKGMEAQTFVHIDKDDILITRDSKGKEERTVIKYKELVFWLLTNFVFTKR